MKRFLLLIVIGLPAFAMAADGFDQRLSQDQQILQALNRLTFGPRPGDVAEVKRIGLAAWIARQLHPEKIAENPALEVKLKPLASLTLALPLIVKEYTQQPDTMMMMAQSRPSPDTLLSQQDLQKVRNGTAEERTEVLKAMDPDKRKQLLTTLSPNVLAYTPEFKQEAEDARKAQNEMFQREDRKRNPRLSDLLDADQVGIASSGNTEQIAALLGYLDKDKRVQVANLLTPQVLASFPELRRQGQLKRSPQQVTSEDFKEAKVFRAVDSNRQLEEVLVDFWFNHFNVDQAKVVAANRAQNMMHLLVGSFERDAIRPHVLGHFRDLLLATARHPAMLYYLDNWQSMSPTGIDVGPFAPQRATLNGVPNTVVPSALSRMAHGLNENYGREVMELHTLGVGSGYTQEDVINVARCFTGWTVRDSTNPEFVFAPFMHDFNEKVVLGHKIAAGGGEQDGVQAVDILSRAPATAKYISRKLAEHFIADQPPAALVDRMAATFTKTDGDLRAVLETMFASPEFLSQGAYQSKIKSPFEMVVSAVRAVDGDAKDAFALVQKVSELGEPLYNRLEPNGYPESGDGWLSAVGVMGRMNFSAALAFGMVPGVKLDPARFNGKDTSAISHDILGREPSSQTQAAIAKGLEGKEQTPAFIASLLLGSPDFQRR